MLLGILSPPLCAYANALVAVMLLLYGVAFLLATSKAESCGQDTEVNVDNGHCNSEMLVRLLA